MPKKSSDTMTADMMRSKGATSGEAMRMGEMRKKSALKAAASRIKKQGMPKIKTQPKD